MQRHTYNNINACCACFSEGPVQLTPAHLLYKSQTATPQGDAWFPWRRRDRNGAARSDNQHHDISLSRVPELVLSKCYSTSSVCVLGVFQCIYIAACIFFQFIASWVETPTFLELELYPPARHMFGKVMAALWNRKKKHQLFCSDPLYVPAATKINGQEGTSLKKGAAQPSSTKQTVPYRYFLQELQQKANVAAIHASLCSWIRQAGGLLPEGVAPTFLFGLKTFRTFMIGDFQGSLKNFLWRLFLASYNFFPRSWTNYTQAVFCLLPVEQVFFLEQPNLQVPKVYTLVALQYNRGRLVVPEKTRWHQNCDPGRATALKSRKHWMSSVSTRREEDRRRYRPWR